jgi:hypothetical protein
MVSNFSRKNRGVCEVMRKNIVERVRLQKTVWRRRISPWVLKATDS